MCDMMCCVVWCAQWKKYLDDGIKTANKNATSRAQVSNTL